MSSRTHDVSFLPGSRDDLSVIVLRFQRLFAMLVGLPLVASLPPALLAGAANRPDQVWIHDASTYAAMILYWLGTGSLGLIGCRRLRGADVYAPALLRAAMILAAAGTLFVPVGPVSRHLGCLTYIFCCWPIPLSLLILPIISLYGLLLVSRSTLDETVWQPGHHT